MACAGAVAPLVVPAQADPLPNAALTPGDTLTSDVRVICVPGYPSRIRARLTPGQWSTMRRLVKHRYNQPAGVPVEVDHLISLELGGSNSVLNLWPEPYPSAYRKDSVENWLHRQACAGKIMMRDAQHAIATDWRVPYRAMHGAP